MHIESTVNTGRRYFLRYSTFSLVFFSLNKNFVRCLNLRSSRRPLLTFVSFWCKLQLFLCTVPFSSIETHLFFCYLRLFFFFSPLFFTLSTSLEIFSYCPTLSLTVKFPSQTLFPIPNGRVRKRKIIPTKILKKFHGFLMLLNRK